MDFKEWILKYCNWDTPRGDLARDIKGDTLTHYLIFGCYYLSQQR